MPRTIVDIPSAQMRNLDARCRTLGISRAEGVRRAVHAFLNAKYGLNQEGFGLWSRGPGESTGKAP
jgi:metal-responsive CopG/Arc/MetJ family transcriptional regulator